MTAEQRAFPVLHAKGDCPRFVRWDVLSEEWAQKNHGQSLDRLAERGGLDPTEIVANMERRRYYDRRVGMAEAVEMIKSHAVTS